MLDLTYDPFYRQLGFQLNRECGNIAYSVFICLIIFLQLLNKHIIYVI